MAIVIQTLQNKCKKQSKKTKHSQVRKKVNECFPHRLLTVVRVIESAEADSITGKFETKAQILGMRLAKQVCCRPNTTVSKKSI